jgi:hypothetical protein
MNSSHSSFAARGGAAGLLGMSLSPAARLVSLAYGR